MSITTQGLLQAQLTQGLQGLRAKTPEVNGGDGFGTIFKTYMDLFSQTNDLQISAERIQLDFASGKTDDMLAVALAQEKAFTSLNFTVQVTTRIIEAYRELMRMQV